ncbi:glycosyltransferase [Candidatus Gottesmanbacteria bacterium]|nr:glycosyltransferase [Candidatus Gottesmanbacteria bacterium]
MKIAHIIPTYNEKENIAKMIDIINSITKRHASWTSDIIVVDDFSPDGTSTIVKKLQKKYKNVFLLSKKKEGLGKALIQGYEYAVKKLHADVVIPNDADFQWNPEDFPKLMKKIENGFDVAVASRHVRGGRVIGWNWFRNLNHNVSNTLLAWWVAGVHEVKDHAGNFKAIRVKGILDKVHLSKMKNAGFSFQLHILYELSKTGARFCEVPVTFKERVFGKSKIGFNKYYLRDILEYIKSSLLIRYDRSRVFPKYLFVGSIGFILQTLISKLFIINRVNPGFAVSIGAEGAIISNFVLNNYWTFSHNKITGIRLLSKFIQFNLVSVGAIFIQGFAVGMGTYIYGGQTWFMFMVLSIIFLVIPYSYFIYNKFIWKTRENTV